MRRLIPILAVALVVFGLALVAGLPALAPGAPPAAATGASPNGLVSPLTSPPVAYGPVAPLASPLVVAADAAPAAAPSATRFDWMLPANAPLPPVPADNPMSEAKFQLGRHLFYDRRLSGNAAQSCASCHVQALAFTDGARRSTGSTGDRHPRNAQTLTNVAYNSSYTWANSILTEIEKQVQIPMFGEFPVELGITGKEDEVLARFKGDAVYRERFAAAFPGEAEPVTWKNMVYALGTFTRGLVSFSTPYDHFVAGDASAMSESAQRGMAMFLSERLECHHCHTGFNLSASTRTAKSTFVEMPFFNTGLYNVDGQGAYPATNQGLKEVTNDPEDMGRFRPPSLRNVALTAPYMHDGSMDTLDEVVRFYERGGRLIDQGENAGDGRLSPLKNGLVAGFQLTDAERQDLIAFLTSLTDRSFITNPRFSDPFAPPPGANTDPVAPAALPAQPTAQILSKAEYRARLERVMNAEMADLSRALAEGNLVAARDIAQRAHDELHQLHATSWQLGIGQEHNTLEALVHRDLVTPLSSPDAYAEAIGMSVSVVRAQMMALLNRAQ